MGRSVALGRALVGMGSLLALFVTPVFALSYYPAYGGLGETPPGWLADLVPTFTEPLNRAGDAHGHSGRPHATFLPENPP
jgi:hypothetical protein